MKEIKITDKETAFVDPEDIFLRNSMERIHKDMKKEIELTGLDLYLFGLLFILNFCISIVIGWKIVYESCH